MYSRFSQDVAGGMGLMSMKEFSEYQSAQGSQMIALVCTMHNSKMMIIFNSVFSTMYHLSRNGARFQMFAPNQQQMNVMDHMRKQPASGENR